MTALASHHRNLIKNRSFYRPAGVFLAAAIFLFSRLYHLSILPIFLDEAIHIKLGLEFGSWLDSDGTRLLIVWLVRMLLPWVSDILWSGRLISVFMGLFAALGCYLVGQSLFGRRSGVIAFILYAVNPFTLSNDRLLMNDVYLAAWAIWAVWLSLEIVKRGCSWRRVVALGLILGLAPLSKLTGFLIWVLPLAVFSLSSSLKAGWKFYLKVSPAYLAGLIVSAPIWLVTQRGLGMAGFRVNSSAEANIPVPVLLDRIWQNSGLVLSYLWAYLTPAAALMTLAALLWLLWKRPRDGLLLAVWVLTFTAAWVLILQPFILTAAFLPVGVTPIAVPWVSSKFVLYPRHILPAFPALFIALAYGLDSTWRWLRPQPLGVFRIAVALGLAGAALWPMLYFDYYLWFNPALAPFPAADRYQYIEGAPAGYGIAEVRAVLQEQARQKGDIYVAMQDRINRLSAELYFEVWRHSEKAIHPLAVPPGVTLTPQDFYSQVSNPGSMPPLYWVSGNDQGENRFSLEILKRVHLEPIAVMVRPGNKSRIYVYAITPKDSPPAANIQPAHPVQANFSNRLALHGYDQSLAFDLAGQKLLLITLYWQALAPMAEDYTVSVHLIGPDGQLLVQHDSQPVVGGFVPTSTWQPAERIKDRHVLNLPANVPPGKYQLHLGVYNYQSLAPLRAVTADQGPQESVELGSIELGQQP